MTNSQFRIIIGGEPGRLHGVTMSIWIGLSCENLETIGCPGVGTVDG